VSFQLDGDIIRLRYIFDGPISEDDQEGASVAGAEVIADFSAPMTIAEEVMRLDHPLPLSGRTLKHRVYERKEATTSGQPAPRFAPT
jgi:hypothetical protein